MKQFDVVFLHIGTEKTGSKAIQITCNRNRKSLARHGIAYPSGIWHAKLGSFFSTNPLQYVFNVHSGRTDLEIIKKEDAQYIQAFSHELSQHNCSTLILSYEGYVGLDAPAIFELRKYLLDYTDTIRVLAYCRHPISFAPSEISQRLRMGSPAGLDDNDRLPIPRFRQYFEKFEKCFGAENMVLKDFHRESLYRQDVVFDFLKEVGFPESHTQELEIASDPINPGLSAEAGLIAKEIANTYRGQGGTGNFFAKYNPILSGIKGTKIRLSPAESKIIMAASEPHLAYLERNFGLKLTTPAYGDESPNHQFGEEFLKSIAVQIRQLVERTEYGSSTTEERSKELIALLYQAILRRKPDSGGSETFVRRLNAGEPLTEIVRHFMESAEFRNARLIPYDKT